MLASIRFGVDRRVEHLAAQHEATRHDMRTAVGPHCGEARYTCLCDACSHRRDVHTGNVDQRGCGGAQKPSNEAQAGCSALHGPATDRTATAAVGNVSIVAPTVAGSAARKSTKSATPGVVSDEEHGGDLIVEPSQ